MGVNKKYIKIILSSVLISIIGVFIIDYFSHLLFSNPMETPPYFLAKLTLYFVFSIVFLSLLNSRRSEFIKVLVAGVIVALTWGAYYNIFPAIFNYYPFGFPLRDLTFLGMGLLGTGLAFGIVHTLAFLGGYYSAKYILNFKNID